ncbi:carboxyl transferase domain-containing protein [Propioniciclava soli]|uniref:Carboxyl transferase domain-containing protein n=1 Tax=Propioniciclava soli TaxID=2775081 RepID=A0ABZ3C792_9ACTN
MSEAEHARSKLTARERLSILLDEASFQELGALATHHATDFGMDAHRYPKDGIIPAQRLRRVWRSGQHVLGAFSSPRRG